MIYTIENTIEIGKRVRVFVNGREVKYAIYADTEKGIVRHYDDPPKVDKVREEIIWHEKHGKVTVEPIET